MTLLPAHRQIYKSSLRTRQPQKAHTYSHTHRLAHMHTCMKSGMSLSDFVVCRHGRFRGVELLSGRDA